MIADSRAVFFDAGGTLFHPYPSVGEIYAEVAARHGCKVDPGSIEKKFREIWHGRNGMSLLVAHSGEKEERQWWHSVVHETFSCFTTFQDFESFFTELYDVFARPVSWQLYPEVHEVLEALKRRGKILGIVSNWDSRLFELCRGLEVERYFEFILASAVFGASKPNPKIFEEALRRSGFPPGQAVHIGDSLEDDIQGARLAGIKAVWLHRGREKGVDPAGILKISDLRQLL